MKRIKLTFEGDPVAQGRPRFARKGNFVQTYDPDKSKQAKLAIRKQALQLATGKVFEGAILVEMYFFRSMPKSFSKKKAKEALAGELRPLTKPDTDNYIKLVLDAINGIFYKDDSQVVEVIGRKFYSEEPRTEIIITSLEGAGNE